MYLLFRIHKCQERLKDKILCSTTIKSSECICKPLGNLERSTDFDFFSLKGNINSKG